MKLDPGRSKPFDPPPPLPPPPLLPLAPPATPTPPNAPLNPGNTRDVPAPAGYDEERGEDPEACVPLPLRLPGGGGGGILAPPLLPGRVSP